jgi:hypothetical protein
MLDIDSLSVRELSHKARGTSPEPRQEKQMSYNPDTQQTNLLHDLADGITGTHALDQAVSVLIEWGLIDAEIGGEYIKELGGN